MRLPLPTRRRAARRPSGRSPARRDENRWGYAFVAPLAVGLAIFYLWPVVRTLQLSFTTSGPFGGSEWTGLENYGRLLEDPQLLDSLRNTLVYSAIVLLAIPLSVVVAALLNQRGLRGRSAYRLVYFLPVVTMPAAVALVWGFMYNGDFGILNYFLGLVGLDGRSWLTDPSTVMPAIAGVGIWLALGNNIVIFLAGLQGIPQELYDAAALDGAGPVRSFRSITLPLLTPSIFFVTVISLITSLQVFDLILLMVDRANPALPSARSLVYLFYEAGFLDHEPGYAAAIAFVLLVLILGLTVAQFRLQRRWVHYA